MRLLGSVHTDGQIGVVFGDMLSVFHIFKFDTGDTAFDGGLNKRRLIERPDVAEGEVLERGLLLFQLRERVPVIEEEILEGVVLMQASGILCAPEADQAEGLNACADTGVENVR